MRGRGVDAVLIRAAGALFRSHGVERRFGMALVGQRPEQGKMWVEGEECTARYLVQEQLCVDEVKERDPIKTMWVFDDLGKHIITLGCCLRTTSGTGHTGRKHPAGG